MSYCCSHEYQIGVRADHPGLRHASSYAERTRAADVFLADIAYIV